MMMLGSTTPLTYDHTILAPLVASQLIKQTYNLVVEGRMNIADLVASH